jgi:hypothetical protein
VGRDPVEGHKTKLAQCVEAADAAGVGRHGGERWRRIRDRGVRTKGWFGSVKSIRILHLGPSIWGGEGVAYRHFLPNASIQQRCF